MLTIRLIDLLVSVSKMLHRSGQDMVYLHATYKTTKYAIPRFLVCPNKLWLQGSCLFCCPMRALRYALARLPVLLLNENTDVCYPSLPSLL